MKFFGPYHFQHFSFRNLHYSAKRMSKSNQSRSGLRVVLNAPTDSEKTMSPIPDMSSAFEVLNTPVKSFSDKKEYKVIKLKNGLTACLICDTSSASEPRSALTDSDSESDTDSGSENASSWETDSEGSSCLSSEGSSGKLKKVKDEVKLAAAALCVGVGSFSDPKEVPGLAHFLEHMVFMGSEKFPQENDFDSFITKHGGSDNGSTDYEVTTFYFECFEKYLSEALDKFAQFFISPLMKKDSLSRERESVESEFQMAVPADDNRIEQLLLSLADKSSPVNSFSWGNLVSLRDNISDDEVYEKLHEFRKRHYSAHRMTVAVQARLPVPVLESYVVNCFSNIPTNNLPTEDFSKYTEEVFNTPQFTKLYYVKPAKDTCQVILNWIMPPLVHMYKSKPHDYVSWLLGHEGQGSLLSYLKKNLWAFSLEAGTGSSGADFNSLYTAFSVTILLTKEGYKQIEKVIEAVFSYISLLKKVGPSQRIFNEIQTIEEVSFRFDEEENPCDIVENIVENMQIYPPEDYLTGSELFFEYAPDEITKLMNYLIPSKVNIMILSMTIPDSVTYNKVEPWFQTRYAEEDMPEQWLAAWKSVKPLPCFMLPEPNTFLTDDFSILPTPKYVPEYPLKILNTPLIELWYKKDEKFGLPVAYYYYYLFCPYSTESTENTCMMQIFELILNMNLMEEGYPAKLADLSYSVTAWERGLLIKVVGYNEKLPKLLELIAKYIKSCADSFDEVLFEMAKSKQKQNVYNALLKPSKLCNDVRSSILQKSYFLLLEKYLAFSNITYEMMKTFSKNVLKNVYIQGLIQGNLLAKTALDSTQKLLDELDFKPIESMESLKVYVNEIPKGERCCRVYSFNKENINSVVTNYYQCGPLTIKENVILEFILLLLEEPLFDTLRTKEQLGYSVFSTIRDTYGMLGYSITVHTQASKYTTKYVDDRIEEFIKNSQKILQKMSAKKFYHTKEALTQIKQVVDVDLEDEVDRHWEEIVYGKYEFDRIEQEIDYIEKLKCSDVLKWWNKYNMFTKKNRCKKLSIQVVGHTRLTNPESSVHLTATESLEIDNKTKRKTVNKRDIETVSVKSTGALSSNSSSAKEKLAFQFVDDENVKSTHSLKKDYFITDIKQFKLGLTSFPKVM